MATINTHTRPFDELIEKFEVRIQIAEIRSPEDQEPAGRKPVDDRFQVRLDGLVENDTDAARKVVSVSWQDLTAANFPGLTAGDLVQLRALVAKLHSAFAAATT